MSYSQKQAAAGMFLETWNLLDKKATNIYILSANLSLTPSPMLN